MEQVTLEQWTAMKALVLTVSAMVLEMLDRNMVERTQGDINVLRDLISIVEAE